MAPLHPCRLRVETPADLQRAVLQSSSASIALPELELALSTGSAGGLATTVGRLISSLADQLGSAPSLSPGEGLGDEDAADWASFLGNLKAFAKLEKPWTLELTDPLDCSLIGAPPAADSKKEEGGGVGIAAAAAAGAAAPAEDVRLSVVRYERTPDENDHFGMAAGGGAAPNA